jgi:hypothetical protein
MDEQTGVTGTSSPDVNTAAPAGVTSEPSPVSTEQTQVQTPAEPGVNPEASPAPQVQTQEEIRTIPLDAHIAERNRYQNQVRFLQEQLRRSSPAPAPVYQQPQPKYLDSQYQQAPQPSQDSQPAWAPQIPQAPHVPQISDEDFISGAQLKQIQAAQSQTMQAQLMRVEGEAKRALGNITEQMIRSDPNYSDYDTVIKLTEEMARTDPRILDQIWSSENPARAAYIIGQMHPNYRSKFEQSISQGIVSQIQQNTQQPKTLSSIGGAPQQPAQNMSLEEAQRRLDTMMGFHR